MPPKTLEMLILRCLTAHRMHGYMIQSMIRKQSKDALDVPEGSLYPTLHKLESKRWITAEWDVSKNNRKAKYYSITETGLGQLSKKKLEWNRISVAIANVLRPWPKGTI